MERIIKLKKITLKRNVENRKTLKMHMIVVDPRIFNAYFFHHQHIQVPHKINLKIIQTFFCIFNYDVF